MKGQAYINGKDVWVTWGVTLYSGAYEALLTPAPMKDYIISSSRLEHGKRIIADSSNAKTDSRDVSFSVFIEGESSDDYLSKYEDFINELCSGMIELQVPKLKRTYKLVYTNCSKYGNYGTKKGKFTLKFMEANTKDRTILQ